MSMFGKAVTDTTDLGEKYIIWGPASGLPPKMVFDTRQEAIKVAYKMAKQHIGERFAVCKIVGEAQAVNVEYKDFDK